MIAISEQPVSGTAQSVEYAGFWLRVAAYFLDYVIIAIIMMIILVIGIGSSFAGSAAGVISSIISILISLLYYPYMESSARQATFGKSLAGIKVTDLDGNRLSFGRALLRTIAKILSVIPFCIGFLLAAFTPRKQALHDMLAKSLVVRTGPSHVLKVIVMAVGGIAIVIACAAAYFYYVYLPQVRNDVAGMMQDATKEASVARSAPTAPQVTKKAELPALQKPGALPSATVVVSPVTPNTGSDNPTLATDEPEAVYAKFHKAGLTADFDEMLKYGTAQPELKSMPATQRQAMLEFLAQILPKAYTVTRKTIDPDGKHATLHLDASGAAGTIALTRENGIWRVADANWGGSSKRDELPSDMHKAITTGAKTKDPQAVKESKRTSHTEANEEQATASGKPYQTPLGNAITPKYNDVMTAVLRRNRAAVTELLDLGWWVNKPGALGMTPLMAAVDIGDTAMAELLLKRGADPNLVSSRGDSALRLAKRNKDTETAALLKRHGATIE